MACFNWAENEKKCVDLPLVFTQAETVDGLDKWQ